MKFLIKAGWLGFSKGAPCVLIPGGFKIGTLNKASILTVSYLTQGGKGVERYRAGHGK